MRRFLRILALAALVGGGGLWFFGGMNTGGSQWTEDAAVAEHAPGAGPGTRAVFRPGLGFLAGSVALSGVLLGLSLLAPPPARGRGAG